MAYESGGAGLWSTIDDYLKFARLFLGDGAMDGVRLLRPETLSMMMTNQLTDAQRQNSGCWGKSHLPWGVDSVWAFGGPGDRQSGFHAAG